MSDEHALRRVDDIPEAELGAELDAAIDHRIEVKSTLVEFKTMRAELDDVGEFHIETAAAILNVTEALENAIARLETELEDTEERLDRIHSRLEESTDG